MANPTGKGGFRDHPQHIRRNGKRDEAATLLRAAFEEKLTKELADKIILAMLAGAAEGNPKDREHVLAMAGIDLKSVVVKGDKDRPLIVQYVNDWRDRTALPPSGTDRS